MEMELETQPLYAYQVQVLSMIITLALRKTYKLSGRHVVNCLFLCEVSNIGDVIFSPYFRQHLIGLGLGGGVHWSVMPLSECHLPSPLVSVAAKKPLGHA
jgi:hypothetical protein